MLVLVFFVFFVLVPTLFVLSFLYTGWGDLQVFVFANASVMGQIWSAVGLSFGVALTVTAIDLVFGLPLAWFIVRRQFRGKSILNTIVDSPLAVPTAGLGFSAALFWALNPAVKPQTLSLNFTNTPFVLLMLLHFTTTFPYMVRSLSAILEQLDIEYEVAARTLGASPLTASRTVTLPLFRSGIATGAILCLAKAMSDTGGGQAALQTANLFAIKTTSCSFTGTPSGTVLIGAWRNLSKACPTVSNQFKAGVGFSFLVAGLATRIDLMFGVPLALYITRGPSRRFGNLLDSLVNIPYIVPSAALGFSLFLFWKPLVDAGTLPILAVIVLAHVGFTIPFVVRNAVGALEEMDPGLDDTSRTLGARPLQAFRRITFPVVKPAILAGSIMAFTRSVGETGATLAVSPQAITAPVYIVNLLNTKTGNFYLAGLSVAILTIVSAAAMMSMRYLTRRAR